MWALHGDDGSGVTDGWASCRVYALLIMFVCFVALEQFALWIGCAPHLVWLRSLLLELWVWAIERGKSILSLLFHSYLQKIVRSSCSIRTKGPQPWKHNSCSWTISEKCFILRLGPSHIQVQDVQEIHGINYALFIQHKHCSVEYDVLHNFGVSLEEDLWWTLDKCGGAAWRSKLRIRFRTAGCCCCGFGEVEGEDE